MITYADVCGAAYADVCLTQLDAHLLVQHYLPFLHMHRAGEPLDRPDGQHFFAAPAARPPGKSESLLAFTGTKVQILTLTRLPDVG
jgi:hypothetical protein